MLPEGVELPPEAVVTERKGTRKTICNYLIDGAEILEETEWKGKRIPLFPVYGQQLSVKGKSHCVSVIRHARDAQKLHNFYRSSEAETISLGSKAPWVGYRGQFEDPRWGTANSKNWAYLEVEPVWSTNAGDTSVRVCGATLAAEHTPSARTWRAIVDRLTV